MIEAGDTLPFSSTFRDDTGALANVPTVTLTITLDGAAVTPVVVTNPPASTGQYELDYPNAVVGRYVGRWLFTTAGGATSSYSETFDVDSSDPRFIVSLATAKRHLNIPVDVTDEDEEVRDWLLATTELVEDRVGTCVPRTVTEVHYDPGVAIWPRRAPLISVTGMVPQLTGGITYTVGQLVIDTTMGRISRLDGLCFTGPQVLTYLAGRRPIGMKIRQAALIILAHLWETQRGPSEVSLSGGDEVTLVPGFGFAVPNRALELLGQRIPGVA